jgi:hypothetical protein
MIPPNSEVRKLSISWARNGGELLRVVGGKRPPTEAASWPHLRTNRTSAISNNSMEAIVTARKTRLAI